MKKEISNEINTSLNNKRPWPSGLAPIYDAVESGSSPSKDINFFFVFFF